MSTEPPCPARGMRAVRAQLCPPRTRRHSPTPHSPAAGSTLPKGAGGAGVAGTELGPSRNAALGTGKDAGGLCPREGDVGRPGSGHPWRPALARSLQHHAR